MSQANRKCADCIYSEKLSYDVAALEKMVLEEQTKLDDTGDIKHMFRMGDLQDMVNDHKLKVRCVRYPTDVVKRNEDWCGEFDRRTR